MKNLELLERMINVHNLDATPYEVFLGKLQVYLNTQLQNKEQLVEMFTKSGQLDAMIECPDCGTHTLLGFKQCNFCGCSLLENVVETEDEVIEEPVKEKTKKVAPKKEEKKKKVEKVEEDKANEPISNIETKDISEVEEDEATILKMRMPNLIRIVNKYGLQDEIDVNDEKKYGGRKIKKLREDICNILFGDDVEEKQEEEPVKEKTKKVAPKKEEKKKKVEKVEEDEIEEEEGDELPSQEEIFSMTREELIKLIKKEKLGINEKRYRKLETLQEVVDNKIDELFGEKEDTEEVDEEVTEVNEDTPDEEIEDDFGLDDLTDVDDDDLDLEIDLE